VVFASHNAGHAILIGNPQAEVREEKKLGVEYPGHTNLKPAKERHPAMLWDNQTDSYPPCQNGTAQNPQTHWRRKSTGAPPPEQLRLPTPETTPDPPKTPPVPPVNNVAAHLSEIEGVPPGYVYIHTPLPSVQFSNHDAYANDRKHEKDFDPDFLPDEETSTGWYTMCCMVMQQTSILQTTAAN